MSAGEVHLHIRRLTVPAAAPGGDAHSAPEFALALCESIRDRLSGRARSRSSGLRENLAETVANAVLEHPDIRAKIGDGGAE